MRRIPILTLLLALAAIALGAAPFASASRNAVYVADACVKNGVKPKTVVINCGDFGLSFTGLKWSSFGGRKAKATGVQRMKTCDPSCAEGGIDKTPVKLTFSRLRRCKRSSGGYFPGRYYRRVRAVTAAGTKGYQVPCPDK